MHADIRRNTAGLGIIPLPRCVIPTPPRRAIGQFNRVFLRRIPEFVTQRNNRRVQPQLQNRINPLAHIAFNLGQPVNIPRIEHQRLLANHIRARSQSKAAMRVMQIIRRRNRHIIKPLTASAQFVDMAVKALELGEKMRVGKVTVENTNRVIRIVSDHQVASRIPDSLHMPRRNIARSPDQRVCRHGNALFVPLKRAKSMICPESRLFDIIPISSVRDPEQKIMTEP